ncbi:MAG: 16S rRNA (cytosine(1402)-N(4))-methyltransferase RsmH [Metamycoplasmataceae bacterium]
MKHIPVMLDEVIQNLDIKNDGIYVDLTLGNGGHSKEILKRLNNQGMLIGFDKDQDAIERTTANLSEISNNFKLINSDFKNLKSEITKFKIHSVNGILIDLGVSSPQLDQPSRGFSYRYDSHLDMRMDMNQKIDAHYIVNNYSVEQLRDILNKNAEVKESNIISNAIVKNRPINTTLELDRVIKDSLPAFILRKKNPSKAVFQAIRIEVNNELESLKIALKDSLNFLKKGSKLLVITFHSIEDRIVKNFFGDLTKPKINLKLPVQEEFEWKVKTINVSKEEAEKNKRSRSSKLRILSKLR